MSDEPNVEKHNDTVVVTIDEEDNIDGEPVAYILLIYEDGMTVAYVDVNGPGKYEIEGDGTEDRVALQTEDGAWRTEELNDD